MRNLHLLLLVGLLFVTITLKAQTKEYQITPEVTAKTVVKYQNAFSLYDASRQTIDVPEYDTTYVVREEYSKLISNLEELKHDSIKQEEEYLTKLNEYNEAISIVTEIDNFLKSDVKFKEKKDHLLNAQQVADKLDFDYLIYADKTINQDKTTDYFSLKLDKTALNNHLIQIRNDISRQLRKPSRPSSYSYSQLNNTRNQLSRIERYDQKLTQKGTYKTKGIMLGNQIEDLTTISGTFKVLGDYYIMKYDYDGYIADQLVEKEIIENKKMKKYIRYNAKSLMEEVNSGKLYYGTRDFLYNCGTEVTLIKFIDKLNGLGYKTTQDGDDIFINTPKAKLMLTSDIYKNVNDGNNNYINEIANSVQQFNALVNQAKPLTDKLVNHFNAYQHATLTTERLNQWKEDVANAQKIYEKMQGLKGRDIDNLYNFQKQINTETLEKYNDFWQVLSGSKQILGM